MSNHTVLVLADPTEPQLAMLEQLPPETGIAVGNNLEAFQRAASNADVIFNWSLSGKILRDVFHLCPQVQWIHSRAAGLDNVIFPELVSSPVVLTNGSGVFSPPLGEFVLGAILYFAKDFRRMIRNQEAGRWSQFDITEIARQTVGIVGYGDIGRAVAQRVHAMGMRVLAMKRHCPDAANPDPLIDRFYTPAQLPEMLPECDYVVVAAPLTPETRSMIGAPEFSIMKRSAVVINVGRGPVIDETAIIQTLAAGMIWGAALDVFDQEPLPPGHPFYSLPNLLLSPHCADHTPDWLERAMRFFIEQFERFADGQPLRNVVEKHLGY
jgi:phosphoglycerate dehydrogenase-like enzyme